AGPSPGSPYWGSDVARQWHLYGPPLRPSPADVRAIEASVRACRDLRGRPLKVLLWGVTPEIAAMSWPEGTRLLALEKSQAMIDLVWPGDVDGFRKAVLADWFEYRCIDGRHDIVIGDGNFAPLDYPRGYRALAAVAHEALTDTGILVSRFFIRPALTETPEAVFEDLLANRIESFHTFKVRLAGALQESAEGGVAVSDVLAAWKRGRIDMGALLAMTRWRRETVEMIYLYEGKTSRLSFPDVAEIDAVMSEYFDHQETRYLDYEMGDRCPIVTYRVRRERLRNG
ncbi:MAG TPA: hypothetical protein VGW79_06390, partial [Actinomycetota bacterium]|nr:hypothetical protein [Actinomycetota bacterium]